MKPTFNQHDIVVLTKAVTRKGEYQFPAGSIGTIVHHHPGDKAFEVEFLGNLLATVKVDAMRPEYTCVYCGCTDSHACAGGCYWVEQHQHTPTGVCNNCQGVSPREILRAIPTLRRQKTCLEKRVRHMERDQAEVKRGQRVIKWAARWADGQGTWNAIQLRRAVKAFQPSQPGGSR